MMQPDMIESLQDPASFPDKTENISVVQTHISVVFIADRFVYKVKKPVDFGFLDFSTLEKRRYYCHEEVRLNRRLARGIYLDVLPVRFDGKAYRLGMGGGEVVEYAVKMRRIPEEKLMKSLFAEGRLDTQHLREVARVLAHFHQGALRTPEIDAFGAPQRFRVNTDENFDQVSPYKGRSIPEKTFELLRNWTDRFYREQEALFHERIQQGRIRDCHGDLHMEHVCFTADLDIIDCIEFNERFRYGDTVADLAFLLMDLEYHGGAHEAGVLWCEYEALAREQGVEDLLTFYKVYRAFVRGKVHSFQVEDQNIPKEERERALERARKYFQLAQGYIES
jgi:aminoglycoside phosphotransferase family enzyme